MSLKDKNVVVTGGSRGLGLGLVEALVAHDASVTVVARDADALESVRARLGVATISADETAARRILAEVLGPAFGLAVSKRLRMASSTSASACLASRASVSAACARR